MRPSQVLVAIAAFSSLSAALQWPGEAAGLKGVIPVDDMLFRRQDNSDNSDNSNNKDDGSNGDNGDSNTAADAKITDKPTPTDDSNNSDDTKETGKSTKGDDSGDKKTTKGGKGVDPDQATKTFAATVQPGGVSIQTPAMSSGPQYYKIGDPVTFGWNYTSLRATPTKIDVLVSCQSNQATYTIQANVSAGESQKVIWDTGKEATGTAALPMASYTLIIMDSDSDVTATPEPGHLSVFNQFTFGMYIPQKYTPLSDFECPTCNSAISVTAKQTMTFAVITTSLTVLSFTWFARGFGVL